MNPPSESVTLKISGLPVSLPVHGDLETTEALALEVEKKMRSIEEEGGPVSTQRFALRAAYEFAAALKDIQEEQEEDNRELIKALEKTAATLKQMVKRYRLGPLPPQEEEDV